ncbi:hypothetical protein BON30_49035 [Cystobacter ferrugineus]|uniref:Uncharacterized protein n=1 Tax=Cystobacter ferrugineus TaxID=83449 RepID=A0A1L9ATN0_9BACT|nr:hypothetical protein BON30_49035 [Cystobacter ferrugineus]
MAGPDVSAVIAGAGAAAVPVVQLDEALEQTGKRGAGSGGEGRFAEEWAEPVELELAPLPCWKGLGEDERQRAARALVEEVEVEARARNKPVLGARAVRAQNPHTRPEHLKRSPRPLGHASTRQALRELREQYRGFVAAFREAAARWGRGDFAAPFPPFSFPLRVVPGCVAQVL